MVDLADQIFVLVPSADFSADVRIEDNGGGPRIVHWDAAALGRQQPTEEELSSVTEEQVVAARVSSLRAKAIETGAAAEAIPKATKGALAVVLRGFNADRDVMRAIIDVLLGHMSGTMTTPQAIGTLQTIRSLVPSALTMTDAELLRQQAIANGEAD